MTKRLWILCVILTAGCVASIPVLAGTTRVNHGAANTPLTVSFQTLTSGANRTVTLTSTGTSISAGQFALEYTLGQQLTSGNLIGIAFSGAAFAGQQIHICAANGGTDITLDSEVIGTATPSAGTTIQYLHDDITQGANAASGNIFWITDDADCKGAAAANLTLMIPPMSHAANATVTIEVVTNGGTTIDTASTATLFSVASEWTPANLTSADTVTIDYVNGPANGTAIVATGNGTNMVAATDSAFTITKIPMDYDANAADQNAGFSAGMSITLTDSANWDGIDAVYMTDAADDCAIASNAAADTSPVGTVTLTDYTGAANGTIFNGTATASADLCVRLDGSVQRARVISGIVQPVITAGAGSVATDASTSSAIQTWTVNTYQAVVPYLHQNSAYPTYCVVSNTTDSTVNITGDILSAESAVTGLTGLDIGALDAGQSGMVRFYGNEISLFIGSTPGIPVDISAMGTDNRYTARLTVTGDKTGIFMTCYQTDPVTGAKRYQKPLTREIAGGAEQMLLEWK